MHAMLFILRSVMGQEKNRENPASKMNCDLSREFSDVDSDFVALDPKVQEQLGRVFRSYCEDLLHQPIPDKFVVLLAKLEARQREKK